MALRLNIATTSYYRIGSNLTLDYNSVYTVCGWIYPVTHAVPGNRTVFNMLAADASLANAEALYFNDGNLVVLGSYNNVIAPAGGNPCPAGQWSFVAMVRQSPSLLHVYRNGVLLGTCTTNITGRAALAFMNLGTVSPAGGEYVDARYWGWKIWQRQLTLNELAAESLRGQPMQRPAMWAWWPFLQSNRALDASGNGHNWAEFNSPTNEDPPPVAFRGPELLTEEPPVGVGHPAIKRFGGVPFTGSPSPVVTRGVW